MDSEKTALILDAATRAFERYGYRKTSIDSVAQTAGVAKGTVYLACKSKEDLFYQVVTREVHRWMGGMAELIDPRKSAAELLSILASKSFETLERHPLVKELLLAKAGTGFPAWTSILDELRALTSLHVTELLRLGIRQGVFRAEIDVEAAAALLRDLPISTYVFYTFEGPDGLSKIRRRRDAAMDLILNGLRPRTA